MSNTTILLISILSSAIAGGVLIWIVLVLFKKEAFVQQYRPWGPQSHLLKGPVPTGGGVAFVIFSVGLLIFWMLSGRISFQDILGRNVLHPYTPLVLVLLFATLSGVVGFIDDYVKFVSRESRGIPARWRLLFHIIIGLILGFIAYRYQYQLYIPWLPFQVLVLGPVFFVVLSLLAHLGTTTGANFTDGLDGLCGGVTILALFGFLYTLTYINRLQYTLLIGPIIGLLIAFLLFNWRPAKIYMGESGSLYLGALLSGIALMNGLHLFLLIYCFVYLIEVLSVILQVISFRLFGKRIFKMAPLHHHFEQIGIKEVPLVLGLYILAFAFVLLGIGATEGISIF